MVAPADAIVPDVAVTEIPETFRSTFWLAEMPSPVAVTVIGALPRAVEEAAVRVRVLAPVVEERVVGLPLQAAVTPVGSPETLRLTGPLNEPPS